MCLQNNLLKRRSIGYVILNKFKQVPLSKSVQVCTSANAFVGIANWIIKRRSKVHQKSISRERTEQFQQWKRLFENHKPIRVWLWFVYKVIEDNPYLRLFAAFIHTQERSSTTLVKVVILTLKYLPYQFINIVSINSPTNDPNHNPVLLSTNIYSDIAMICAKSLFYKILQ